jgi:hypothetical protein
MGGVMNATQSEEPQNSLRLAKIRRTHRISENQPEWLSADEESPLELPVEFAYVWEEAFAQALDQHGILWQYKPRTFAVEWDDEGNFVDSFTPDFYLPLIELYVELVGPDHYETASKARKVRLLRRQKPELRIQLVGESGASFVKGIFLRRLY